MERSAPLCYWGLAVCREGCEPETSDTDGCCARAQFLFCCCVTGKLRGKSSPASSGAFPTTSCSTAVSCLWLLTFFSAWPGCCPHAGCLMEAQAVKHTLSICQNLHSSISSSSAPMTWSKVWVPGMPVASASCGISSLPGKKEWKAVSIPFHSSAMSCSLCFCHCWLWLDIIIPDVKRRLVGG